MNKTDMKKLEEKVNTLIKDSGKIQLDKPLAGGVVSEVYSGKYIRNDGEKIDVAVKHTFDDIALGDNFCRLEQHDFLPKASKTHNLDVDIQKYLTVKTPEILQHFYDEHITIMKNFEAEGYKLMQTRLIEGGLNPKAAGKTGEILAKIRHELENKEFQQIETSEDQFEQRFFEFMAVMYDKNQKISQKIERDFLKGGITWTDGHPKNFAVNDEGDVMAFDFGRSVNCDPEYALPNFLGQIFLFILAGTLGKADGFIFVRECIDEYQKTYSVLKGKEYKVNEDSFVNYSSAELLHRGLTKRWISYSNEHNADLDRQVRKAVADYADLYKDMYKSNRVSIDRQLNFLKVLTDTVAEGRYYFPSVKL